LPFSAVSSKYTYFEETAENGNKHDDIHAKHLHSDRQHELNVYVIIIIIIMQCFNAVLLHDSLPTPDCTN